MYRLFYICMVKNISFIMHEKREKHKLNIKNYIEKLVKIGYNTICMILLQINSYTDTC